MDAIVLIVIFAIFIVPWIIAKLWWWVGFWCVIAAVLAITELVSFLVTKKTISQRFWAWRKNPNTPAWQKWLILGGMLAFWGYLICHLFLGW